MNNVCIYLSLDFYSLPISEKQLPPVLRRKADEIEDKSFIHQSKSAKKSERKKRRSKYRNPVNNILNNQVEMSSDVVLDTKSDSESDADVEDNLEVNITLFCSSKICF